MPPAKHWLTLTFVDKALEREYEDDLFERYQRRQTPLVYLAEGSSEPLIQ
jgi:hypothetical protein